MNYKAGDFLELANGRTVRLTQETAEIANAAYAEGERDEANHNNEFD